MTLTPAVVLDMDAVDAAHERYKNMGPGSRDDSVAMQYFFKDWKFDSKRPGLMR